MSRACNHAKTTVRVSSHEDIVTAAKETTDAIASVWVCSRPACVRWAEEWVFNRSRRQPVVFHKPEVTA